MLEGKRIRLRGYRLSDVASAIECFSDYDALKTYRGSAPMPLPIDVEKHLRESDANRRKEYDWVIEKSDDQTFLGSCGYSEIDWQSSHAQIGLFVAKPWRNQGFGGEAVQLLVSYMFQQMNLHKVELNVFAFNPAAVRLYERIGFIQEGRLRQRRFRDGSYHDEVRMGLLREEWLLSTPISEQNFSVNQKALVNG
jgi:RimJ/RimL family protein N-acetyltransferase